MRNYISMDKKKAIRSKDIVAILSEKGKVNKSRIIAREGGYASRTSPRKLAERLEGGKETSKAFKKRARE